MKLSLRHAGQHLALLGAWFGIIVLFGILSDHFLAPRTFSTLANRIPALAVVSAGMTLVLVIGGIDLSVGSIMGLCGAIIGVAMVDWGWSLWAASALAIAMGMFVGSLNGIISVGLGVPSFIVTLGMLEVARGLAYKVAHSETKYLGPDAQILARPLPVLGISWMFVLAALVILIAHVVLTRSVIGRKWIAIGTNETVTRLAGVGTVFPRILVFILSGLLAGLGAVFYTSRMGSADPNAGAGLELSAIAAVVIGGTSLMGGKGSVLSAFIGVLIIATLEAGLAQVGAREPSKRVITGAVIIAAVVLNVWRQRMSGRKFRWMKIFVSSRP